MAGKIVVTGASGGFGRAAIELLLGKVDAGQIIGTTRKPEGLSALAERGVDIRAANFDRPETLAQAFAGAKSMLLISTARVGSRVGQHRNAIEAAKAAGVEHIVYTSILSAEVPDNPAIVAFDHRDTEADIRASGLDWTFLRDSQYSEAVAQAMAPAALATGRWQSASGEGRVSLVSRDDCVASAVGALIDPAARNRAFRLTGPDAMTLRAAIAMVAEVAGRPIEFHDTDDAGMFAAFDALGVPRHASDIVPEGPIPWSSDDMVTFDQAIREGMFDHVTDDVEELSGRKPRTLRSVLEQHKGSWPL